LDHLRAIVEREGVTTIFTEELVSPRVAETLARETGATTEVLDPLESLTPDEVAAGQDYLSVMRSNLSKLEAALGCS
jgi:zinc transport system substrate-binding protein